VAAHLPETELSGDRFPLKLNFPFARLILFLVLLLPFPWPPAFCAAGNPLQEGGQPNFDNLAKAAAGAREAGKIDEAVRAYQHAVEMRADWEEGWWYLGTLQYDADRFADAIPALQKVVQLDPGMGPAWNFLGLCEFETHDYGNSLEHLKKGQELGTGDDPEISRVSRYHIALLMIRNGEFEKAGSLLASTFTDQPSPQVKAAMGLLLLRGPLLPQEVDPSQDALVQAAGETAAIQARNNSPETLDSFRALLKKYPNTPFLHYAFGMALASAARNEEALMQQREEVKISPRSALPFVEISLLEVRLRHPHEALRAAEDAVRLAPSSQAAHRARAQSLQATGQTEKAAAELRATEALKPENPERNKQIVELYTHHTEAAPSEGGAALHSPDSASSTVADFARQAGAAQAAGNNDDAMRIYRQALQAHPDWDEGRWSLAMVSYSTGHYPEAIAMLKICVARKPNYGTAWAVMGLSEFETKDYNNALIHLQRGQDLGLGGSAESVQLARYRLGSLLNRDGQFDRATELLVPEADSPPLAKEIRFTLGLALLRINKLPDEVESSKKVLIQTAGQLSILLQASKYDEAFPKFQALLRQYPSTPFLHSTYGTALAALSQYDDAESELRKELPISPSSEIPYVRLASIALKRRSPEDALPSAQKAVQLAPNSAEAHYLLGRSCLELGQEEKAVQELEIARKIAPSSPEVHFNLAKAYARANLPEKAEQERATFARLNAMAEDQRSRHGNQSYSGSHDQTDFSIPRVEVTGAPSEAH
jgi:tetratricopeptide (TPR) repeat protein